MGQYEIEFSDEQTEAFGRMFFEKFDAVSEEATEDDSSAYVYGAACLTVVQHVLELAFTEWGIGFDADTSEEESSEDET